MKRSSSKQYLSANAFSSQIFSTSLSDQEQLLKWSASLPMQPESDQIKQIERVLVNLIVNDLDNELRLELMKVVVIATERLVTALHKHYSHESEALNAKQLSYSNQIKSLYYLCILIYDGVMQRECMALSFQQSRPIVTGWRRFLKATKNLPLLLAGAIYSSLIIYQKLQYENTLCYQKPPKYMWSVVNELYYLAHEHNVTHLDLSGQVVTRQGSSIHHIFKQLCLHNLLNVRTMSRPSIILLQRLLPLWAELLTATIEPQTSTRVFINLKSDDPPSYLSADSTINPYDEHYTCLFIEMQPLVTYLEQHKKDLSASGSAAIEYWLVSQVLMSINYRYLERQSTRPTKYSPKQRATIITEFNRIHYHVAQKRSLMDIIDAKNLPVEQRPRDDTAPTKSAPQTTIEVETFDSPDVASAFRTLQLLTRQSTDDLSTEYLNTENFAMADQSQVLTSTEPIDDYKEESFSILSALSIQSPEHTVKACDKILITHTAPPPLRAGSLFLLCRPDTTSKLKYSLGIVRWLHLDHEPTQIEWQVLGHTINPCALRLHNPKTAHSRFAPAFIIAGDDDLQTAPSLLVPPYHFNRQDRVIIRINNEQKSLRLQRCLLSTKEFSHYEFIIL